MDEQMDRHTCTDRKVDRQKEKTRQMGGQKERQTDRKKDGQIER